MVDTDKLDSQLNDSLGQSQPRGAGFSDRMAAGAMRRIHARRLRRRVSVAAIALTAALVVWSSRAPADGDHTEPSVEDAVVTPLSPPAPLPGQAVESPGTSLLWVEAPFDDPVLVDGKKVGTANRPIEVTPGEHEVSLHDAKRRVTRWRIDIAPGQWQRLMVDRGDDRDALDREEPPPAPERPTRTTKRKSPPASSPAPPSAKKSPASRPTPPSANKSPASSPAPPPAKKPPGKEVCDEVSCLVDPARACCGIGLLSIGSRPAARVFIDGRDRGWTPLVDLRLSPGNHRVTLVVPDSGIKETFRVKIDAGQKKRMVRDLEANR